MHLRMQVLRSSLVRILFPAGLYSRHFLEHRPIFLLNRIASSSLLAPSCGEASASCFAPHLHACTWVDETLGFLGLSHLGDLLELAGLQPLEALCSAFTPLLASSFSCCQFLSLRIYLRSQA